MSAYGCSSMSASVATTSSFGGSRRNASAIDSAIPGSGCAGAGNLSSAALHAVPPVRRRVALK